ncbi:Putative phage-type endonuclease [uncultured Caudovirales phage]|uniref:Phage-type endonuclease n=1 Tax=uncultured Caudovirales phage TaxID=2100421 RepID=A0A6J7XNB2_9CAUD|nr:Putative phage-type endonuclease [uncultured Caudovirales phage]
MEDRKDWLERRRKVLGASEVAAVLGISKFQTPLDVWLSKVQSVDAEETQAMRLGHRLQPAIAQEAAEMDGLTLMQEEVFSVDPGHPWAGATVDYLAKDANGLPVILECKATWQQHWEEIPDYYQTQLAWQCWVHGVNHAKIAVLHGSTKVATYDFNLLEANSGWFADVVQYCSDWWTRHILNGERPDGVSTAQPIVVVPGKAVELSQDDFMRLVWVKRAKEEVAAAERQIDLFTDLIKKSLGDAEIGIYDGTQVVTWRESQSSRFDSTAFKKDFPEIHKQYTKGYASRRFLVKEFKNAGTGEKRGGERVLDGQERVALG